MSGAGSSAEFVTAIVPAYNAERTLDATLRSIRSQTHAHLEILVVDDGSVDATPALIARHERADARVRGIRQHNAGVAAARNRGMAEARGDFFAPTDADDVWAPTRIEEQLAVMRQADPPVVLVYTWSAWIDAQDRLIGQTQAGREAGDVLHAICRSNFIGNGSAALVRREAALATGGFDASLRARGAEGCEDIAFYIAVAEQGRFGVVPKALTGYRQLPASMSSDGLKMYRSWRMVSAAVAERNAGCIPHLAVFDANMKTYAFSRALRRKQYRALGRLFVRHPDVMFGGSVGFVIDRWRRVWESRPSTHVDASSGLGTGERIGRTECFPIGEPVAPMRLATVGQPKASSFR